MRTPFFFWMIWLGLTALIFATVVDAQAPQGGDEVVATVNGVPITMRAVEQSLRLQSKPLPSATDAQEFASDTATILEILIERELLLQQARAKKLRISPARVKAKITSLRKAVGGRQNLSQGQSAYLLEKQHLAAYIEEGLMISSLLEKEAYAKAWASNTKIRNYYERHPHRFITPERIRARHILIKSPPDQEGTLKIRAYETIQAVEEKLRQGDDFAALAIEYSQCPSSILGGDLGSFARDEMIPELSEQAFALAPGEVSPVFETPQGYHLIQCVERTAARKIAFQKVKESLAKKLRYEKEHKLSADYVARLKKKAHIEHFWP